MVFLGKCAGCRGDWGPLGRGKPEHCYGRGDRPAIPGTFGGHRCGCECNPNIKKEKPRG